MTRIPIPAAALEQHVIVLGKTRSGKSSTMRLLVESLLDEGKPVCIIDPKGDWWGIKSSADGKKAGYPVVIFGGDHADVPINPHAGADVAELIATGNRPCLIDLKGWMPGQRTKFFVDFASALFRLTRGRRWLVIDECHNFAPQGKVLDPDSGKMLHWANRIANESSGMGLTLISASQRPQKVHKDYVTAHETLIAKRVIHKLDRDAVKDWMDGHGDKAIVSKIVDTLAEMSRAEAWVWSPEIQFGPTRLTFPMFSTYDSFKPQIGETVEKLKGWAAVDLAEVGAKFALIVEGAKANDPKALKTEIATLRRQMGDAATAAAKAGSVPDPQAIEAAEKRGYDRGEADGADRIMRAVAGLAGDLSSSIGRAEAACADAKRLLESFAGFMDTQADEIKRRPSPAPVPRKAPALVPSPLQRSAPASAGDTTLTGPQRQLLTAMEWWRAMGHDRPTRVQLAAKAGWKPKGSNLRNRLSELSSKGLVVYPGEGLVQLTAAGVDAAPGADLSETLIASIKSILTGPQLAIFNALWDFRGDSMTRIAIAAHIGWEATGSNLRNRLSELSSLELIEYPGRGQVALQEWVTA